MGRGRPRLSTIKMSPSFDKYTSNRIKQLQYALLDVEYLIKVFPLINKLIRDTNREDWVEKEIQSLKNKELYAINSNEVWQKIKTFNLNITNHIFLITLIFLMLD